MSRYLKTKSASKRAQLVQRGLISLNMGQRFNKMLQNPPRSNKDYPSSLFKGVSVDLFSSHNRNVTTFSIDSKVSTHHILFYHGGAFMIEGNRQHWKLIKTLLGMGISRISYIDYPLAPEHNWNDTFEMIQNSYAQLIQEYQGDEFIFMGDSAGGGLALSFAQWINSIEELGQPKKIVLFSPWLDLTLTHSRKEREDCHETILTVDGLDYAASCYSAQGNLKNHLISPLLGPLENLPPTLLFISKQELLYADSLVIEKRAIPAKWDLTIHDYTDLPHDWVILPIPEATQAIEECVEFIFSEN